MSRQEEGFGEEKAAVATCCVVNIVTTRVNAKLIRNEYLVLEEERKEKKRKEKKSKEQHRQSLCNPDADEEKEFARLYLFRPSGFSLVHLVHHLHQSAQDVPKTRGAKCSDILFMPSSVIPSYRHTRCLAYQIAY